jgi:hypothetical protein
MCEPSLNYRILVRHEWQPFRCTSTRGAEALGPWQQGPRWTADRAACCRRPGEPPYSLCNFVTKPVREGLDDGYHGAPSALG